MEPLHNSQFSVLRFLLPLLVAVLHAQHTSATSTTLRPVKHDRVESVSSMDDPSLKSSEAWYWGHGDRVVGNLTGRFPGAHQKVINMDRFASLVDSAGCYDNHKTLVYTFTNETIYEAVQQEWEWVNQGTLHSFILTVDIDGCHVDPDSGNSIQPFQVDTVSWDSTSLKATLALAAKNWTDFLGDYDNHNNTWELFIDSAGLASEHTLGKRFSGNASADIDLAHDFSMPIWSLPDAETTLALNCSECFTQGNLQFTLLAYSEGLSLNGYIEVTPVDIGATTIFSFGADGNLTSPLQKNLPLLTVELAGGFILADIFEIGPVLEIALNSEVAALDAEAYVTFGVEMVVPATSIARLDFNNTGNATFQGWLPNVTAVHPQAHLGNSFTMNLAAGPEILISLDATIFGLGFVAGLGLRAPQIEVDLGLAVRSLGPTTITSFVATVTTTATVTGTTLASTPATATTTAVTAAAAKLFKVDERDITPSDAISSTGISTYVATSSDSAMTTAGSFCDDVNTEAGLTVALDVDVAFVIFGGFGKAPDMPNGFSIFSSSWPVYSTCIPLAERTPDVTMATAIVTVTTSVNAAAAGGTEGVRLLVVVIAMAVTLLAV
ncbi:hypothetical protein GQ53DRAFT_832778 [Thozetella sp. PMI_491]|nr:hypothetical protein GQ53DRAFT_832778 [Thozetella sp. PMI_491]